MNQDVEVIDEELAFEVQWEPRWQSFVSNLRPALLPARGRLQAEHSRPRYGAFSASLLLHVAIVLFTFSIYTSGWIHPGVRIQPPDFSHIVYYPAGELPEVSDNGGAQEGESGKSGGKTAFHPAQTIRIARGPKLVDRVVDAPKLKLPKTNDPVANLLALGGPVAPSAPTDSLRHALNPNLPLAMPVAPAPSDPSRDLASTPKLELPSSLVHPAPHNTRRSLAQANLAADISVVQPAPDNLRRSVAQAQLPAMPVGIVQPAPDNAQRSFSDTGLTAPVGVVQPAASNTQRSLSQATLAAPMGVVQPAAGAGKRGVTQYAMLGGGAPAIAPPSARSGNGSGGSGGGSAAAAAGDIHGSPGASGGKAEPGAGGDGGPMGIIVSTHPGEKLGMPNEQVLGSLALSPGGGMGAGFGGSGGGSGIGKGSGPGAGTSGSGPGAGKTGSGLGADPAAKGGTSLGNGPGGAGNGDGGPKVAGIAIHGNTVDIPGFAAAGPANLDPHTKEPLGPRRTPAVVIVASPRSGGAIAKYGALKGSKVYTIYLDTDLGTAILQYADRNGGHSAFREDLTAPELEHTEYPSGVKSEFRLVVSCIIDHAGAVKNLHVLESSNSALAAKMVAALSKWRFRPALRGDNAVDAQAILGFGVDTR